MLLSTLLILLGFVLLTWSANSLVTGAASIADHFQLSPLLIGLTIVALGTSAPEIVVAINASWHGNGGLAIGNALGSNIANIGLVLALTAILSPLKLHSQTLKREYPLLLCIMLLTLLLIIDGNLSLIDGIVLLLGLIVLMLILARLAIQGDNDDMTTEFEAELPKQIPLKKSLIFTTAGMLGLSLGAKILVTGSVTLAEHFGVSDVVIGLTIVAIGTSLPEVATSIGAALKGEDDIAIGNILGSNMFNLLAVMPFAGLLDPGPIEKVILYRDMPVMFVITLMLFIMGRGLGDKTKLTRSAGIILLLFYLAYMVYLFYPQ